MSIKQVIDNMGIPENEFAESENNIPVEGNIPESSGGVSVSLIDILKTETGQGELSEYVNNPLNFLNSEGLAQIIRGVTGFLQKYAGMNSLRLAVIDIVFGFIRMRKETEGGKKPNESIPV